MKKAVIFIVFILISCSKKDEKIDIKKVMEEYQRAAIANGDDSAYGTYLEYADNTNMYLEKLSLSLIMNHKYKNSRTYYFIYRNMVEVNNNNNYKISFLNTMDSIDVNYALHYLKEGVKKNDVDCQMTLESIYRHGYGIEKNIHKSDSLYSILEKDASVGEFYRKNRNNKSKVDKLN